MVSIILFNWAHKYNEFILSCNNVNTVYNVKYYLHFVHVFVIKKLSLYQIDTMLIKNKMLI